MMPQVVQWPVPAYGLQAPSGDDVVTRCRDELTRGRLVILPADAGYVVAASGLQTDAIRRLAALAPANVMFGVRDAAGAEELVRVPSFIGYRLAGRGWPGPLVLTSKAGTGSPQSLSEEVRRLIAPDGELALCAPCHPIARTLIETEPGLLVIGELIDGNGEVVRTSDVAERLTQGAADLIVDAGPTRFDRPATIVAVREGGWSVRREGVLSKEEVGRLAARWIVFVCTGNTCRSPLAAALCQRQLANRLGCSLEELTDRGYLVTSAGLAAFRGEPAATEAVTVARELRADLSAHASRPATPDLLGHADLVVAMTAGHLDGLEGWLGGHTKARLLCVDQDLPDPIGGDMSVYQTCAGTIWQHMTGLVDELLSAADQQVGLP
jgi:protein-tyrosine phosphatase